MRIQEVYIMGEESQAGTYVLRVRLSEDAKLQFGRFRKSKLILLPAGDYTYVGSALSEKGSTSLARRLVRHATRSGDKPPHLIRDVMIFQFQACELGPKNPLPKSSKKLFWNIDYMLDLVTAEIINIIAIRSPIRLESTIAKYLEQNTATQIIEKGLGANDSPKNTHVLRIDDEDRYWESIANYIQNQFIRK